MGANVITNEAPATDHHAKVTLNRDNDSYVQMEECEESQSHEECEKEVQWTINVYRLIVCTSFRQWLAVAMPH